MPLVCDRLRRRNLSSAILSQVGRDGQIQRQRACENTAPTDQRIHVTAILCLGYLAGVSIIVTALTARYLRECLRALLIGLPLWLIYVGLLSYSGVVSNTALRPPGIVYVALPAVLFVLLVFARSGVGARIAAAFPVWVIIGMQTFRIGVELLLHRLWVDGLAPRIVTYQGSNADIWIGLSAPLIAWLSTRGRWGERLAFGWNVVGLITLANAITLGALTAPGLNLIHGEVPNVAIGAFPFTYIAGFFAPLAMALHALSIRGLRTGLRSRRPLRAPAIAM